MAEPRIRIAVVFGGRSGEHEVSRLSAASALEHLRPERYHAVPVQILPSGVWTVGRNEAPDWSAAPPGTGVVTASMAAALAVLRGVDVVLPLLHGPYGEDGTIQSLLARTGIPYVGNGTLASAAGMDKEFTKKLLVAAGLPVADSVVLRAGRDSLTAAERDRLGLPVFVKPSRAGSSLGVSRVDSWDEFPAALAHARDSDVKVLVEEAVQGREVDLGVLEFPDGRVQAGPPLEIRVPAGHEFFDFEAKYTDHSTVFDIPARLPAELAATLQEHAVRAFRALGCAGLLRVDFFLRDGVTPVVNEVNTLPGFTAHSQYPQMWAAAGLPYADLLDVLVDTALHGARRATVRPGGRPAAVPWRGPRAADPAGTPAAGPGGPGPT